MKVLFSRTVLRTISCIIPAIVIAVCVIFSLSGYEAPVYSLEEDMTATDPDDAAGTVLKANPDTDTKDGAGTDMKANSEEDTENNTATDTNNDADVKEDKDSEAESKMKEKIQTEAATLSPGVYADGIYTAEYDCYDIESEELEEELEFDYVISVTVTIEDDRITDITDIHGLPSKYVPEYDTQNDVYILSAAEGVGDMEGVVEQILQSQNYLVDAVSGATCSSDSIMDAVRCALQEAKNNE